MERPAQARWRSSAKEWAVMWTKRGFWWYQEMKGIWTDFAFWDHSFVDWNLMKGDGYEEVWRHQKGKELGS